MNSKVDLNFNCPTFAFHSQFFFYLEQNSAIDCVQHHSTQLKPKHCLELSSNSATTIMTLFNLTAPLIYCKMEKLEPEDSLISSHHYISMIQSFFAIEK